MTDDFSPLTVADYASQAITTDRGINNDSLAFPLLGLFGETGSLLSEVKKKQRDRASYIGYAGAVVEELGDVLWYLTTVAVRGGLDLDAVMAAAVSNEPSSRQAPQTFADLQPPILPSSAEPTPEFERTLLLLAAEVGALVADYDARRLTDRSVLASRLTAISHFAANVLPIIRTIQKSGVTTLAGIAEALNARGVPTARGGRWHVSTVMNLLRRSANPRTTFLIGKKRTRR